MQERHAISSPVFLPPLVRVFRVLLALEVTIAITQQLQQAESSVALALKTWTNSATTSLASLHQRTIHTPREQACLHKRSHRARRKMIRPLKSKKRRRKRRRRARKTTLLTPRMKRIHLMTPLTSLVKTRNPKRRMFLRKPM